MQIPEADEIRLRMGMQELVLRAVINTFDTKSKNLVQTTLTSFVSDIRQGKSVAGLSPEKKTYLIEALKEFQRHI